MAWTVIDLRFEMWWERYKDVVPPEVDKQFVKTIWLDLTKTADEQLNREKRNYELLLASAERVSQEIERGRNEIGVPGEDYWENGVAALVDAALSLREEAKALRDENVRLKAIMQSVYREGYWTCEEIDEERQVFLWETLRDACGLEKGTATKAGVGHNG
jgi:hypothetical protein